MIKLRILGNSGTGKTAVFLKYFDRVFSDAYIPTVGIDFRIRSISNYDVNNRQGRSLLQAWDASGDKRQRGTNITYCQNAKGFLLIFSVADRSSIEIVKVFMNYIKNYNASWPLINYSASRPLIILVGNKCDLENEREVSYEEAKKIADEWGIFYIETSAKTGFNIESTFRLLCATILNDLNARTDR